MTEAVTPPNPAGSDRKNGPDPTLLTIDALRREIAMLSAQVLLQLDAANRLDSERFRAIDMQLVRSEDLRREMKLDTKAQVDAALEAQKEATHSIRSNFDTSFQGLSTAIADLKDRLTILESVKLGQVEQKQESRQFNAGVVALIGLGVTVLLAVLTVSAFVAGAG